MALERDYDQTMRRYTDMSRRPWVYGVGKGVAEARLDALTRPDDCSGLKGDPRHQGPWCLCRY